MTKEDSIKLEVEILAKYSTNESLYDLGVNLLKEVKATDVESVNQVKAGGAPSGSKSGDVVTAGTLAVQILPAVLPSLFAVIQDWVSRGKGGRTVKFKYEGIEYEGSREDLEKILERIEKSKAKKK